ncbi:DUF1449 family protein [Shewanella sp. VB17]|uniref:OB-fold-containig protein n=1 Tax=Shewanella sp. VB17 TaxID=2739432 RepID=UPI001566E65E|nr:OB-fold-containig protein [Shewanella sp. VB17]NRD75169.1 DUF1449 family protein [Shewanella sp. VB17]
MVEFLFTQANLPFSISLFLVLLLGISEVLSLMLGYSLVGALDNCAPVDADIETSFTGFTGVSGWLCINRLPLLIWFVLVLISFSFVGYVSNYLALIMTQQMFPQAISLPIALVFTAISCRYVGAAIARVLPKNESNAVSIDTLLGSVGTVTLGCAIKGNPSEALVRDKHQQRHYILVEPEMSGVEFNTGTQVILLKREGTVWSAARFDS